MGEYQGLADYIGRLGDRNILFGDTNHASNSIFRVIASDQIMKALAESGKADFVLEVPREAQSYADIFQGALFNNRSDLLSGKISAEKYEELNKQARQEFIAGFSSQVRFTHGSENIPNFHSRMYELDRYNLHADLLENATRYNIKVHYIDSAEKTAFVQAPEVMQKHGEFSLRAFQEISRENKWDNLPFNMQIENVKKYIAEHPQIVGEKMMIYIEELRTSDPALYGSFQQFENFMQHRLNQDLDIGAYARSVTGGRPLAGFYGFLHGMQDNDLDEALSADKIWIGDNNNVQTFKSVKKQDIAQNPQAPLSFFNAETGELIPLRDRNIPETKPSAPEPATPAAPRLLQPGSL